ncbi:MAG: hypothetical protein LBT00_10080, partial [Spirochaetaceae bacterium]|nr:hypothetical protein [Spirochaetaceae bacterium]
ARRECRKHLVSVAGIKSVQSITDWSKGHIPAADKVLCIADYLHVSVRWLLTGVDDTALADDEAELLRVYRMLDKQGKSAVIGSARGVAAMRESQSGLGSASV